MMMVRAYGVMPAAWFRVHQLKKVSPLRLMFGCGDIRRPGWIGIDCFGGSAVDLLLDLRRRLPFEDSSVDYCYSEHFLEHLYPTEAEFHLSEVHRILKPGGVYRIVVPAALRFAQKYLDGDAKFFALAHPWEARPIDALYKIVNWEGEHRSIYDFGQLSFLGAKAGFVTARECQANQSSIPELRIDQGEPLRVTESLYAELTKA